MNMNTPLRTYTIPVSWECYGHIENEASSLDEAIEKAEDAGLPCGEYIEGSFRIDHEVLSDT